MVADALAVRMAHLEGAYEQIDKRLGSLEAEVRDLRRDFHDLRRDLHDQFRWIVGLLILAIFAPFVLRLLGH